MPKVKGTLKTCCDFLFSVIFYGGYCDYNVNVIIYTLQQGGAIYSMGKR